MVASAGRTGCVRKGPCATRVRPLQSILKIMKAWHKEDVFDALRLRGWAGPAFLSHPKDWHYVGETWSFSREHQTLDLYFVADYGTGFHGTDTIESISVRLVGSSDDPELWGHDLWLHRRRDAKWKGSVIRWADQISTGDLAASHKGFWEATRALQNQENESY